MVVCNNSKHFLIAKIKRFSSLSDGKKIKFYWIPVHSDIQENELADRAAKEASNLQVEHCCKIPFSDLWEKYKNNARENTIKTIIDNSKSKGIKYFAHYQSSNSKPWFYNK